MAELNLRSTEDKDGNIRVSWNDLKFSKSAQGGLTVSNIIFAGGAIISMIGAFIGGLNSNFDEATSFFIATVIFTFLYIGNVLWKRSEPNSVTFNAAEVTWGHTRIPINEVTRFEYGHREQLTGAMREGQNPMLIRLWVNDKKPISISGNNWQNQVNHEIRDALDSALQKVRKGNHESIRDERYGRIEEDGLPNYD